jgi:hypothetical protein
MLAIVDDFAGAGMLIRRGASTEVWTFLKQRYAKTGLGERTPCGETSQSATCDCDCGIGGRGHQEALNQALENAFSEDAELLGDRQSHALAENVVLLQGNLLEQPAVDGNQNPQSRLAVFVH